MAVDPFAFLRAEQSAGDAAVHAPDSGGTAASESDLFAGSEPVATSASAPAVAEAEAQPPASPAASAGVAAAIAPDVLTAALLDLDERVRRFEQLARQNGWAL